MPAIVYDTDEALALLALGLLVLMVGWVPFLELLRRIVRGFHEPMVNGSDGQDSECRTEEYLNHCAGEALDFREESWEERLP